MNKMQRMCLCFGAVFVFVLLFLLPCFVERFEFQYTMTFGNLVQAAATSLTGLIVASIISRLTQADKTEKETLFKLSSELLPLIKEFNEKKDGSEIGEINTIFAKLKVNAQSLVEVLEVLKYDQKVIDDANLNSEIDELWDAATNTPINQIEASVVQGVVDVTIRDGILQLTKEKRELLETQIKRLRMRIYKIQMRINRA